MRKTASEKTGEEKERGNKINVEGEKINFQGKNNEPKTRRQGLTF